MNKVSLCCVACNEASRIRGFIDYHRPFFEDIVIVDSGSIDTTVVIAKSLGVKVVHDKHRGLAEPSRHIGALNASNEWILYLDADEYATPELLAKLSDYANGRYDGYMLERHDYVDDVLIKSEINQYRLFNRKNAVFNWFLHGGIEPVQTSRIGTILNGIDHKKSTAERDLDHDTYSQTIMYNPESISPFWYLAYQAEVFPVECMLTMIVTTSAKHSNPDCSHIETLFNSYNKHFGLTPVRKILVVDGFDEACNVNNLTYKNKFGPVSLEKFEQYKDNLRQLCPRLGVELIDLPVNKYMDGAILEATTRTSTPYYFYTPDDIIAKRDVHVPTLVKYLSRDYYNVKRLNFHHYEVQIDPFNWQLIPGTNPEFNYLKTPNWSQNTHIGYTHHYNYAFAPTLREIGRYPLELVMNKRYNERIKLTNFDIAFQTYGCCLYGSVGDAAYVEHDFSYLEI